LGGIWEIVSFQSFQSSQSSRGSAGRTLSARARREAEMTRRRSLRRFRPTSCHLAWMLRRAGTLLHTVTIGRHARYARFVTWSIECASQAPSPSSAQWPAGVVGGCRARSRVDQRDTRTAAPAGSYAEAGTRRRASPGADRRGARRVVHCRVRAARPRAPAPRRHPSDRSSLPGGRGRGPVRPGPHQGEARSCCQRSGCP